MTRFNELFLAIACPAVPACNASACDAPDASIITKELALPASSRKAGDIPGLGGTGGSTSDRLVRPLPSMRSPSRSMASNERPRSTLLVSSAAANESRDDPISSAASTPRHTDHGSYCPRRNAAPCSLPGSPPLLLDCSPCAMTPPMLANRRRFPERILCASVNR